MGSNVSRVIKHIPATFVRGPLIGVGQTRFQTASKTSRSVPRVENTLWFSHESLLTRKKLYFVFVRIYYATCTRSGRRVFEECPTLLEESRNRILLMLASTWKWSRTGNNFSSLYNKTKNSRLEYSAMKNLNTRLNLWFYSNKILFVSDRAKFVPG